MTTDTLNHTTDIIPTADTAEIVLAAAFQPNGTDHIIAQVQAEVDKRRPDLDVTTTKGRAAIRSTAAQIAKMKVRVDDMGKAYVAQLKELPKVVDAERKRFRDTLDAMADEVRAPLTEYEDREKTRVSEREEWIATILRYDLDPDACDITRLDSARTVIKTLVETMDWQEFSKRAYDAYAKVDASLREKIACKVQAEQEQAAWEAEQAEARRREQAEREAKIATEAADRARREAEAKADNERRIAEDNARFIEQEKRIAEERAVRLEREAAEAKDRAIQAEVDRKAEFERQNKAAEDAAERRRNQAIEEERRRVAQEAAEVEAERLKRERDAAHVRTINRAILAAFVEAGLSPEHARIAATAVIQKKVPNVEVRY